MIDRMMLVNFAVGVAGVMMTLLGLILTITCSMERWMRRYFITNFAVMIVYSTAVAVDHYALIYHVVPLIKPLIFVESLSSSLLMPMLTVYMLRLCKEEWRSSRLLYAVIGLWGGYFALLIYTQFTTVIYSVSSNGVYSRGPMYPLLLVPPAAVMLLNLIGLIRRWHVLSGKQRYALLIYISVPLAAMIVQMFTYGLLLIAFGTIAGGLAMFVYILSDQMDIAIEQVRENAEKEFSLRVLQMRPHFIYNAMTSIYYLVDTDPQMAKEAIRGFSKYLHKNFSAVVKTEEISFEEELAHTKAYLTIEQARFGDRLEVTYDTRHTLFHLPPLTLEPIVENAVKHGMDPDSGPLHILIRTRVVENGSEITVINDGAEFKHAETESDGVGLNSVRERLSVMCGGTLRIASRSGGGATVTMWIPQEKELRENAHRTAALRKNEEM